jgi:hypothetical protein
VRGADLIAVLVSHDVIRRELTEKRTAIEAGMRRRRIVVLDE